MDRKAHWKGLYAAKGEREVSWFQEVRALSLELILSGLPRMQPGDRRRRGVRARR